MRLVRVCSIVAALLVAVSGKAQAQAQAQVKLTPLVEGLRKPVLAVEAPGDARSLFIVEQDGLIRIARRGKLLSRPFLDIRTKVSTGGERGLLGFVFDPAFRKNGRFFINYTRADGATVVSSMRVLSDNPNRAAPSSEVVRLTVAQPFANHNGGNIVFGRDRKLYVGMGDGGSGGDPQNNAQNLNSLLGKMLRIDVSGARGYKVPRNNPFVGNSSARSEIYAFGIRNPWRFSFDRGSGKLFVADVGQGTQEEVSIVSSGDNLGWKIKEGTGCFDATLDCSRTDLVSPILTYTRDLGTSITGGYVYRGRRIPSLVGRYIFADFISGTIFEGVENTDGSWERRSLLASGGNISSFGQRANGELLVVDYGGIVYSLSPQ